MSSQSELIGRLSELELISNIKMNGVNTSRVTKYHDHCDFYRNLNKQSMFSCRQRFGELKNKVSGYANIFIIEDPSFVVSKASRERVLRTSRKNVHAYVRGKYLASLFDYEIKEQVLKMQCCTYNPYIEGYFFDLDTKEKITKPSCKYAILMGSNVDLTDLLPII